MLKTQDAKTFLSGLKDGIVDLICSSPPYAETCGEYYETVTAADYPEWTLDWLTVAQPKLTESGNVAIIIRSHVRDGAVDPYVLKTRLLLRRYGWYEPEELVWVKSNSPSVGHVARPRRSWEHILWFSRSPRQVYCAPKANGGPTERLGRSMQFQRRAKKTPYVPTEEGAGVARCPDVVKVGTAACHRAPWNYHPAQCPEAVCRWIIRLLSPPGGLVVDPLMGSGTSLVSARKEGRRYAGCDLVAEYLAITERRLRECIC
jgi:DNA modification methylase